MLYIYILKLENNKYYIGKTQNPQFRINDHFEGYGSVWTQKYKPIKIVEFIKNCDIYDEDKYTLKYMKIYGIHNVRGGSFCSIKLTPTTITTIEHMIKGANDICYNCGQSGHFANNCKKYKIKTQQPIRNDKSEEDSDYDIIDDCEVLELKNTDDHNPYDICDRCFRLGHDTSQCYARTDVIGNLL